MAKKRAGNFAKKINSVVAKSEKKAAKKTRAGGEGSRFKSDASGQRSGGKSYGRQTNSGSTSRDFRHSAAPKPFKPNEFQIEGKIQGSTRGYAFLIPTDKDSADMFIPEHALYGAMHGDTVLARQTARGNGERGGEAEVVNIVKRGFSRVVGTFEKSGSFGFVCSDDKRIQDVYIALENSGGAIGGQKVVAEITGYPAGNNKSEGKIIEVLGYPHEIGNDILSIIRQYGLYEEFSPEVLKSALKAPQTVDEKEITTRTDFRNLLSITIDGEDARDLDDAVSIEKKGDVFRLYVHIADVSHYVKANTAMDKEAFNRGTSVYFPDRVLPMLPRELSNGICSLNENVDRLTLTCIMDIDGSGKVVAKEICESVIKTANRMTYTDIQAILNGDKETRAKFPHLITMAEEMQALMKILFNKRTARGNVDLDVKECKIILNETTGKIEKVIAQPRLVAHRIIEEFMLAANETVAETMFKLKMPFIYRIHETPTQEKILTLKEFAGIFGVTLEQKGEEIKPKEIQALLNAAAGTPYSEVLSKVALRSMMKAKYLEDNLGHFGLAAKYYCHFTSPIRRYPDLMIHRIIKDYLHNGTSNAAKYLKTVEAAALQSSEREKLADDAERDVDDLKKAEYMADHIGEEYEGIISGVIQSGIFVELENTCEGLIRVENLPESGLEHFERSFTLSNGTVSYRLGDKLKVRIAGVDMERRKADFELLARLQENKTVVNVKSGKGSSTKIKNNMTKNGEGILDGKVKDGNKMNADKSKAFSKAGLDSRKTENKSKNNAGTDSKKTENKSKNNAVSNSKKSKNNATKNGGKRRN